MRDLIAELFISLDGYAFGEGAPAYFGYLGPDLERRIDENVAAPQVMLMGRKTYGMMLAIVRDQPVEGADRMNELPKVVFSRTLGEPLAWSNSRLPLGGQGTHTGGASRSTPAHRVPADPRRNGTGTDLRRAPGRRPGTGGNRRPRRSPRHARVPPASADQTIQPSSEGVGRSSEDPRLAKETA